jgi:hypothetical protein
MNSSKKHDDIEHIRNELISLIEEAGSDYKAAALLDNICEGYGPNRSTLTRMRNGEGKPTMVAMTTILLRYVLKSKIGKKKVA